MGELSAWHWVIIAVVFLVLFGAAKLPVFAKSLGESMRIFKKELRPEDKPAAGELPPTAPQQQTGSTAASAAPAPVQAPAETTEPR